jgi:parvulin-like peptidyl-prolyl isomerase
MDIAIVNGYRISEDEYKVELVRIMKELQLEQPNDQCKTRALQYLIDGLLILQKARDAQIDVSPDDVQNRMLDIMMKYGNSDEYYSEMARRGLNEEKIRDRVRDDLMVERYVHETFQNEAIDITDEQLHQFYVKNIEQFLAPEKIRASHLLLSGNTPENREKVFRMREAIHSEDDFNRFVSECSECPSAEKCGDLGYFTRGMLISELEDPAFLLEVGEISQPIESDFGWHLLMVTERRPKEPVRFEQIREVLRERLRRIEAELRLLTALKQLRSEADIIVHEVYL